MPPELQAIPDGPPPPLGKRLALAGVVVSRGRPREAARQRLAHVADRQPRRGDRRLGLRARSAGLRAGAPNAAGQRLDPHRRPGFLPDSGIRHRRAYWPMSARTPTSSRCRCATTCCSAKLRPVSPAVYDKATKAIRETFWKERSEAMPAIRPSIPMPTGSITSWPAPRARPTCCLRGAGAEAGRTRRGHLVSWACAAPSTRPCGPTWPRRS